MVGKGSFTPGSACTPLQLAESLYKTPALVIHRVRCGKPTCHCATGEGHGPYGFLYWREGTRQRRRYVKRGEIEEVQEVVERRRTDDCADRRAITTAIADLREVEAWLRTLQSR